ncbi:cylicin-2-like [Panicum virgatum]|uniref:Uncharacterized protein n=1 Tax=Panicum virgatum TaxID=38727 RepID=A0A8T0RIQ7_PANVG|nr:cylicin-2-like [Panicum virgatum]XP_039854625.1 cylicin-2-like [Panicum virgatum]XP_039854626.1 cylicin-2-like [Panicum virgatum]KAG2584928.1 hypothetical protein PVAP13_6KG366900 [Panicum virgatum]
MLTFTNWRCESVVCVDVERRIQPAAMIIDEGSGSGQVGRPPCLVGTIGYMGRPRGKSKKAIEAASNDDEDGSSGGEEVPPTPKRRGRRPHQKPLNDDADDKDAVEAEEDAGDGGAKPVVRPSKDSKSSSAEGGGKKRRRRRLKRGPDELAEEAGEEDGRVKSKSNGFRPNGSRRKSTPRRAAEAGVECK